MKLFWDKVQVNGLDECWPWIAAIGSNGYGSFTTGWRKGVSRSSHRCAYFFTHGLIPEGLQVMHSCDNRLCCNPLHLSLGSCQDNMSDKVRKGRSLKGETNPYAKLSEEEVKQLKRMKGTRKQIAKHFGISKRQVYRIMSGDEWRHVT